MILAQLDSVPATTLKWAMVIAFALLTAAGIAVGIWSSLQKKSFAIEPQPVAVKKHPTEYNPDFYSAQHGEVVRRLDSHDAQIDQLWNTMRDEDKAIRQELANRFRDIAYSLGRIEARLGTKIRPDDH